MVLFGHTKFLKSIFAMNFGKQLSKQEKAFKREIGKQYRICLFKI